MIRIFAPHTCLQQAGWADYFGAFLFLIEHLKGIDAKNQLQKPDEFLATRMKKAVISGSAKSLWKDMEHQQVEKIFAGNCSGLIFSGFGIEIPECNHAVFAFQDILFLYDAPVEISARIYQCLVSLADIFTVNYPF